MPTRPTERAWRTGCLWLAAAALFFVTGCIPAEGDKAWERTELYFGMRLPDGTAVTEEAWGAFLADEITPRFPDGLTVIPASGQWRGSDGRVVSEATRVVVILHPRAVAAREAFDDIRAAYRTRFRQESVLLSTQAARVSF